VWRRGRIAAGAPAFRVVVALTSGEVLVGPIGHATRLEYTVMGEAVNLAAKLEKHTRAEGVSALTTRDTLELAMRQGFRAERRLVIRSRRQIAGVDVPVDVVVLDGALAPV
jgi:adenylate cyclase